MGCAEQVESLNGRDAMVFGDWSDPARGLYLGVGAWSWLDRTAGKCRVDGDSSMLQSMFDWPRGQFAAGVRVRYSRPS
jgi:hypothetical protein